MIRVSSLSIVASLLCGVTLYAQRPPAISSPEVHADKTITFRYFSRTARNVSVMGEFLKAPLTLTKDTGGIWSVTTAPVKPDLYPYSFTVDGVGMADPNNTVLFPNERFKRSLVDIPSDTPPIYALQAVPHGKVSYRYYNSTTLNQTRTLLVYTPPGFSANDGKRYPVLYLIHGGSDTEETWMVAGKANLIADNLIAQKKAEPMIIVMPYANVSPAPRDAFTKDIMQDIIPFIEQQYPVKSGSESRAIAGFSVGGGQTLNIGLTNTDRFAWIASYAPYTATEEFSRNFSAAWSPDATKINSQLKLFSISIATEDFLYASVLQNISMFEEKKLKLQKEIVPGGHTWMNCRLYLQGTLQRIFRK